jgi:dTDP-4-dehydrorhamnose reductase/dTDP-4-dehydrorhamnose 3,5-epimerase-like enzyme
MNTVAHKTLHEWFDGKVIIDEVKEYKDPRGSLVELWRSDDDRMKDSVMSYWSETAPYVIRGPHEHAGQTDWFVSWRADMVYMLHNPETGETKTFRTDPTKITRVKVAPPIIHSYRNLDNKPSLTGNFPTSLFMGKDKKEKTDEIRHEPKLKDTKVYVVLGAGGRLGKAVVDTLFDNMGIANHQVIPVYERFPSYDTTYVQTFVDRVKEAAALTECKDIVIINCAAKTNVAKASKVDKGLVWANTDFPFILGERCSRADIKLVHFSTDYVYQKVKEGNVKGKVSDYTNSKQLYENSVEEMIKARGKGQRNTTIIRVANLFSVDKNDTLNILYKLNEKVKTNTIIEQDPLVKLGPTDVKTIATWLYENMKNGEVFKKDNLNPKYYNLVSGSVYNIPELVEKHYDAYKNVIKIESDLEYWFDEFMKDDSVNQVTLPDAEASIKAYLDLIRSK